MLLNADKTEVIYVRAQDGVSPLTKEEAMGVCKFTCPHLNCGFKFMTKSGMKIHAGRCEWKNEFEVDHITGHRGPVVARKDYSTEYDTWEPRRGNVHPDLIRYYEIDNKCMPTVAWSFRYNICDLACSSARGISIHKDRKHKPEK